MCDYNTVFNIKSKISNNRHFSLLVILYLVETEFDSSLQGPVSAPPKRRSIHYDAELVSKDACTHLPAQNIRGMQPSKLRFMDNGNGNQILCCACGKGQRLVRACMYVWFISPAKKCFIWNSYLEFQLTVVFQFLQPLLFRMMISIIDNVVV